MLEKPSKLSEINVANYARLKRISIQQMNTTDTVYNNNNLYYCDSDISLGRISNVIIQKLYIVNIVIYFFIC